MTTYNHTQIATGAAANASTFNSPIGELDAAIGDLSGVAGTPASAAEGLTALGSALDDLETLVGDAEDLAGLPGTPSTVIEALEEIAAIIPVENFSQTLIGWAASEAYQVTAVTAFDPTYPTIISTATVLWPDGSAGTLTVTEVNETWETIDEYSITHTASGLTVTQPEVTRNDDGIVTTKPALIVA